MNGKAITSMVTGILSIMLCWTGYVGVALGIVAIVFFGLVYKSKEKRSQLIASRHLYPASDLCRPNLESERARQRFPYLREAVLPVHIDLA